MSNKKTSILAAALLAALALTGWSCSGGYGVSNVEPDTAGETTDATADWQTYRDDTYGVEFKYPQGWVAIPDTQQTLSLLVVGFNVASDESPDSGIAFSVDSKTLEQVIDEMDHDPDMETLQREEATVNGIRWIKDLAKDRNTPLQFLGYFTEHNDKTYQFDIVYAGASPDSLTNERDTGVLTDILESFRFVE